MFIVMLSSMLLEAFVNFEGFYLYVFYSISMARFIPPSASKKGEKKRQNDIIIIGHNHNKNINK